MTKQFKSSLRRLRAFTLVELLIASAVGMVVVGMTYSFSWAGTILLAKNLATNLSNNELRGALDEIGDRVQSANSVPVLVDATGAATSTTPNVGAYYDRILGDPYIITHPGGAGLAVGATSLTVTYSSNTYAALPAPAIGDVLIIDGVAATVRPRITAATAPTGTTVKSSTLTFTPALASAISWLATAPKPSLLVHREAFMVVAKGSRYELRRYNSFEPVPTLSDTTKYKLLSNQVGSVGTEVTPFSIKSVATVSALGTTTDRLLEIDFRIRALGWENALHSYEKDYFSNYERVKVIIPSRLRPIN